MTDLSMNIPAEIVERAVRDKINAAIASQLGNPEQLINALVESALSQKVDSSGKRSRSNYDNKFDFLEIVVGEFMREATKEALQEYMNEQKPKIKEAVKKSIAQSPSKIAQVLVDGMVESMNSRYSTSIRITFDAGNQD